MVHDCHGVGLCSLADYCKMPEETDCAETDPRSVCCASHPFILLRDPGTSLVQEDEFHNFCFCLVSDRVLVQYNERTEMDKQNSIRIADCRNNCRCGSGGNGSLGRYGGFKNRDNSLCLLYVHVCGPEI